MAEDQKVIVDWIIDKVKDLDGPIQEILAPPAQESSMVLVKTSNGGLFGIKVFPVLLDVTALDPEPEMEEEEEKATAE